MPPANAPTIYVATPTVRLDGQDNERISSLITSMVMNEQEGGLSSLELRLSNSASLSNGRAEYAFDDTNEVDFGKQIIIGAGDSSGPTEIFRGKITGLEGVFNQETPPELIILAEDSLQSLRWKRRTKVYENQSLADIAQAIASDHGLTAQVDLSANFGTQVQLNETDLGFLRRILIRADADIQIVGDAIQISTRANVQRGTLQLTLGNELKSARVLADLAHQITKSTVKGWDVSGGQVMQGDGQENATGPGQGDLGGNTLQRAFETRDHHSCHHFTFNQTEVDTLSTTIRNRRARRFLRVQGCTTGTPNLRVGTQVTLAGLGDLFSNTYYVTVARHLYDLTQGYRTEFEGQCAFLGRP